MYQVIFIYHLNATTKYNIIAKCKAIIDQDVIGLAFQFINDADETIRMKCDPVLFEDIESEATQELLDDYYNGLWTNIGAH